MVGCLSILKAVISDPIADLQTALQTLDLPQGYTLKFSGQFEQMQAANERLQIAIPATMIIAVAACISDAGTAF